MNATLCFEQLPKAPPGMHYVLMPESSAAQASADQVQAQRITANQCYVCGAIAIQRCFFGTNTPNQCKNMMCLQHAESTMQGGPRTMGTYYYCQEHFQQYLLHARRCCIIL